ncbi:hypothetical protein [Diaphorobacter sp.]|uniref:hypothetical protein n=1 Tax=Diaphorobacter sp. TaxID=1934310 RepID=UPI0028AA8F10|nr:hypothetical protein [Diaphorobacter sp.]
MTSATWLGVQKSSASAYELGKQYGIVLGDLRKCRHHKGVHDASHLMLCPPKQGHSID